MKTSQLSLTRMFHTGTMTTRLGTNIQLMQTNMFTYKPDDPYANLKKEWTRFWKTEFGIEVDFSTLEVRDTLKDSVLIFRPVETIEHEFTDKLVENVNEIFRITKKTEIDLSKLSLPQLPPIEMTTDQSYAYRFDCYRFAPCRSSEYVCLFQDRLLLTIWFNRGYVGLSKNPKGYEAFPFKYNMQGGDSVHHYATEYRHEGKEKRNTYLSVAPKWESKNMYTLVLDLQHTGWISTKPDDNDW